MPRPPRMHGKRRKCHKSPRSLKSKSYATRFFARFTVFGRRIPLQDGFQAPAGIEKSFNNAFPTLGSIFQEGLQKSRNRNFFVASTFFKLLFRWFKKIFPAWHKTC